jgi:4-amino-4-deoxy-L-arabinose transferase-like glycosyltransferase
MTLIRLYAAFNFPLTTDEAYYWTWSLHPSIGYTDHPPMVAWLITLGSLFGHSYGAVRLPFAIAEAVAALAVGMAAKLLVGDVRAGAYAAIVFALIPQTKLEFAESIPDGAYMLTWALSLWAAAVLARRVSSRATVALGAALAATVYSRTFGWALVFGILAWAVVARRDLLRAVAVACTIAIIAYVPFLIWNASVGWETFAFEFVHRQSITTLSPALLFNIVTMRTLLYGLLIVALTWLVALRRTPRLPLVAWTALPLPIALFVLSFGTQTETYWILGPATSLSIGCGAVLARATVRWRTAGFAVLGAAAVAATIPALFLALPESAQAAAFRADPALRAQFRSGTHAYAALADDLRPQAAAGVAIYTDRYETSSELLWYGLPSTIVVYRGQLAQWMRWYRPAGVPQHAILVIPAREDGSAFPIAPYVRAAYARVGPPVRLEYRYGGEPEGTFDVTRLDDPRPDARRDLPGM